MMPTMSGDGQLARTCRKRRTDEFEAPTVSVQDNIPSSFGAFERPERLQYNSTRPSKRYREVFQQRGWRETPSGHDARDFEGGLTRKAQVSSNMVNRITQSHAMKRQDEILRKHLPLGGAALSCPREEERSRAAPTATTLATLASHDIYRRAELGNEAISIYPSESELRNPWAGGYQRAIGDMLHNSRRNKQQQVCASFSELGPPQGIGTGQLRQLPMVSDSVASVPEPRAPLQDFIRHHPEWIRYQAVQSRRRFLGMPSLAPSLSSELAPRADQSFDVLLRALPPTLPTSLLLPPSRLEGLMMQQSSLNERSDPFLASSIARRTVATADVLQRAREEFVAQAAASTSGRKALFHHEDGVQQRRPRQFSDNQVPTVANLPPKYQPAIQSAATVPPPCAEEGPLRHYRERSILPLAIKEDKKWLSDLLCFVRSDIIEVFRASQEDVVSRSSSKKISYHQVGFRCRFCAHLKCYDRAARSATFASTKDRIYQSITMMMRDHFELCSEMPAEVKSKFLSLKTGRGSQGAPGSKEYWINSASKLGLVDTSKGIKFFDASVDVKDPAVFDAPSPASLQVPTDGHPSKNAVEPLDRYT